MRITRISSHRVAFLAAALLFLAAPAAAQDADGGDGGNGGIRIVDLAGRYSHLDVDVLGLQPNAGGLGLGYQYLFSRQLGEENDGLFDGPENRNWALNIELEANGRWLLDPAENETRNNTATLRFGGHHFTNDVKPLSARQVALIKDLLNKTPDQLTPQEFKILEQFNTSVAHRTRFWAWDGHLGYEATQGFTDYTANVGLGLAFDLASIHPSLATIFDYPFSLFRSSSQKYRKDAPRLYLGYDFVAGLNNTERSDATGAKDSDLNRLAAQVAWSTLLVGDTVLKLQYQAWYELSAPQAVRKADRDFNDFIDVSLRYPVNDDVDLVVQFVDGRLPPNFRRDSVASLGFTVKFGDFQIE